MGTVKILFGTESGNSEMVADDVAAVFESRGLDYEIASMEDFEVGELTDVEFAVVITSTYGEGELPMTTAPFHEALLASRPDLQSLRFAAFGLGDTTYETYGNAIGIVSTTLVDLGANQIGETGYHDASGAESYTDAATAWANEILDSVRV